ncbi:MAG: aldehyde dehydrogenase family protein, partial [Bacilli bacterium]
MAEIVQLVKNQRTFYERNKTRSITWRIQQLSNLRNALIQYEGELAQAIKTDLNKSNDEYFMTEMVVIYDEIRHMINNLEKWAKPKKVKGNLILFGTKSYQISEPYGVVAIIAPWNYPVQLAFAPLVGSIAAGNTSIVKPSELTPNVEKVIAKIIATTFPEQYVACVCGDKEVSQQLLQQSIDYVFF